MTRRLLAAFLLLATGLSAELSNVTAELLGGGKVRVTFDPGIVVAKAWVEWGGDQLTQSVPARRFVAGLTLYRATLDVGKLPRIRFRCATKSEHSNVHQLPIYTLAATAQPQALRARISWNWGTPRYAMVRYSKASMLDGTNRSIYQVGNEGSSNAVEIPVEENTKYYYQVFSAWGPLPPDNGGYQVGSPEFEFTTPALAQPAPDDRLSFTALNPKIKPGESSDLVVKLTDASGAPRPNVTVWLKMDEKSKVEGQLNPASGLTDAAGEFKARFFGKSLGTSRNYRENATLRATAGSGPVLTAEAEVQVRER